MSARSSFPGEKRGILRAGIIMASPVEGLRALRSLCSLSLNVPKPPRVMESPLIMTSESEDKVASRILAALTWVMPAFAAICLTRSALVMEPPYFVCGIFLCPPGRRERAFQRLLDFQAGWTAQVKEGSKGHTKKGGPS